jgi:hypothetical protein
MIKRKFIFTVALILAIVTGFLWHSGIISGLENQLAVQQATKQDMHMLATIIREAVISGKVSFYNGLGFMVGIVGIGFSFIPKNKKNNKKDND